MQCGEEKRKKEKSRMFHPDKRVSFEMDRNHPDPPWAWQPFGNGSSTIQDTGNPRIGWNKIPGQKWNSGSLLSRKYHAEYYCAAVTGNPGNLEVWFHSITEWHQIILQLVRSIIDHTGQKLPDECRLRTGHWMEFLDRRSMQRTDAWPCTMFEGS